MKLWKVFRTILVWLVVLLAVFMMVFTIVSVTTFNSSQRTLFGYRALIVMSDSMSATDFSAGDLVLTRYVEPDTLQPGDIIAYSSLDPDSYPVQNKSSFSDYKKYHSVQPGIYRSWYSSRNRSWHYAQRTAA